MVVRVIIPRSFGVAMVNKTRANGGIGFSLLQTYMGGDGFCMDLCAE